MDREIYLVWWEDFPEGRVFDPVNKTTTHVANFERVKLSTWSSRIVEINEQLRAANNGTYSLETFLCELDGGQFKGV